MTCVCISIPNPVYICIYRNGQVYGVQTYSSYYYSTLLVPACHTPSEFLTTLREQALPLELVNLTRISKYHKNIYIIKSHLHQSVQYVRYKVSMYLYSTYLSDRVLSTDWKTSS